MKESAARIFFPGFKYAALLIFSLTFMITACADEKRTVLSVGGQEFSVEIADTSASRARGLMHRKELPAKEGMLFVFPYDQKVSFWMKNTTIPLTVAYIAKDGTVRELHDLVPLSEVAVPSMRSVRYALELNRGAFAEASIKVGDKISGLPLP